MSYTDAQRVAGRCVCAALPVWLLFVSDVTAQPRTLTQVGSVPGPVSLLDADDRWLITGAGTSVRVLDLTQADGPVVVGGYEFEEAVLGVALDGDRAYVANSHDGLRRLVLSTSAEPVLADSSPTRGQAAGVATSGTHVFVADNSLGFDIVQTSEELTRVGEYLADGFPRGVAAFGALVLVADAPAGLIVVDPSTPEAPTVIGTLSLGSDPITGVVVPRSQPGDPTATLAGVLSRRTGLQLVDLSAPGSPAFTAEVVTRSSPRSVAMHDRLLYVVSEGMLELFDISDPTQPTLVAEQTISDGAGAVAVNDSLVFVGSPDGLVIFRQPQLSN
jgi:hypothetical protein